MPGMAYLNRMRSSRILEGIIKDHSLTGYEIMISPLQHSSINHGTIWQLSIMEGCNNYSTNDHQIVRISIKSNWVNLLESWDRENNKINTGVWIPNRKKPELWITQEGENIWEVSLYLSWTFGVYRGTPVKVSRTTQWNINNHFSYQIDFQFHKIGCLNIPLHCTHWTLKHFLSLDPSIKCHHSDIRRLSNDSPNTEQPCRKMHNSISIEHFFNLIILQNACQFSSCICSQW